MPYLLNLLYLLALLLASPWLVYKAITTGKYRVGMWRKFWGLTPVRTGDRPCVWFHAVSVGEVLLLRQVVSRFRARWPNWDCVLSTTTNTGYDVAVKNYPDLCVFYWPFDFTWAVRRALARIRPSLVVLAELELWPNFVWAVKNPLTPGPSPPKRGRGGDISVVVVNGRMSPRSYRGYARIKGLMRRVLESVDLFAMQNDDYAARIRDLGAPAERVVVTGSVKYDGVNTERDNPKTRQLATILSCRTPNADSRQPTWLVGSTRPRRRKSHSTSIAAASNASPISASFSSRVTRNASTKWPNCSPTAGCRLSAAANFQPPRPPLSKGGRMQRSPPLEGGVILLDTLGELGAAWGLADVAFVGGSLSQRGGQNMIEPAAYGVAVTFGPHVWNFQETVDRLLEQHAAVQVADAAELERVTLELLGDETRRQQLGDAARRFVLTQLGATERTLDLLAEFVEAHEVPAKIVRPPCGKVA